MSIFVIMSVIFCYPFTVKAEKIDSTITCKMVNTTIANGSSDDRVKIVTMIVNRFDDLDDQSNGKGRPALKDAVSGREYGQMLKAMYDICNDTPDYTLEYDVYGMYLAFRIVFLHETVGDLNLE